MSPLFHFSTSEWSICRGSVATVSLKAVLPQSFNKHGPQRAFLEEYLCPLTLTEMEISAFLFQSGSSFQWPRGEPLSTLLGSREP